MRWVFVSILLIAAAVVAAPAVAWALAYSPIGRYQVLFVDVHRYWPLLVVVSLSFVAAAGMVMFWDAVKS